jgi:hypothetical protein
VEDDVVELAMDATSEDWWVELAVRISSKSASASVWNCSVNNYFIHFVLSLSFSLSLSLPLSPHHPSLSLPPKLAT